MSTVVVLCRYLIDCFDTSVNDCDDAEVHEAFVNVYNVFMGWRVWVKALVDRKR